MGDSFNVRVIGQLTMSGRVSLIAEESVKNIKKGTLIHSCSRTTYHKMREPKSVRVFENVCFGVRRVESILE